MVVTLATGYLAGRSWRAEAGRGPKAACAADASRFASVQRIGVSSQKAGLSGVLIGGRIQQASNLVALAASLACANVVAGKSGHNPEAARGFPDVGE